MPQLLKNDNLEVHIDLPNENYQHSRFDWTGKIVKVLFKGKLISSAEDIEPMLKSHVGLGFYNEFGIDSPLGFKEIKIGDWFHKIGVGLLQKDSDTYAFNNDYKIDPCKFSVDIKQHSLLIDCVSKNVNGYAYELSKEISLCENNFTINYTLKNTGNKNILTNEYNHNFIAVEKDFIGEKYQLNFPFKIKPKLFKEAVNLEKKVIVGAGDIRFSGIPKQQFFFSNLNGCKPVEACWELFHKSSKLGIRETGSFLAKKVNLWGWQKAICPEMFFEISLAPSKSLTWSRSYDLFTLE